MGEGVDLPRLRGRGKQLSQQARIVGGTRVVETDGSGRIVVAGDLQPYPGDTAVLLGAEGAVAGLDPIARVAGRGTHANLPNEPAVNGATPLTSAQVSPSFRYRPFPETAASRIRLPVAEWPIERGQPTAP